MAYRDDRRSWDWQDRKMIKEHREAGMPWWCIEAVLRYRHVEPERTELAIRILDELERKDELTFG